MSRTYRTYSPSFFRNAHHRNRLLKEKTHIDSNIFSNEDFFEIPGNLISGLIIKDNEIPPDPWDDISISGAAEIFIPSPAQIRNLKRTAGRFMKHHHCSYKEFSNACFGRSFGFDSDEALKNDALYVIGR